MVFIHIDKNSKETKLKHYLKKKHIFVLIYMEGCLPCSNARPEWKKLNNVLKKYKNDENIIIMDIDNEVLNNNTPIVQPSSYPTFQYITNNGNTIENYEESNIEKKDRSIDSFVNWIENTLKKENLVNKNRLIKNNKTKKLIGGKWSLKYKKSINCKRPKGFSQKQYCKYSRK